ncbi:nucleoside deaminase [Paracoccus sp. S-4012]|uniref:nucleoside deaminase n=1 Tax=Paracoccus sp. S-4012 TaxID=2665648 RepID=UPI0012B001E9|nr:nucleoside deaminase [Paracoccus sp. S-4012]MRX50778.1 nucleoside deaminase [Paracoccus sp. S-4012]
MDFRTHMPAALAAAREAAARGEVPVGAVLVDPAGRVAAIDGNRTRALNDPTAHAEILVLRAGCAAAGSERLPGWRLWVTLEPCPMCAAAISATRIETLYYGAPDPRMGGVAHGARVFDHPQCHHRPEVHGGIAAAESAALLRSFFAARRDGGGLDGGDLRGI